MPIRYDPRTGFTFDTVEEAAAFNRLINANGRPQVAPADDYGHPKLKRRIELSASDVVLTDKAKAVVRELLRHHPTRVPGRDVEKSVGVDQNGTGSLLSNVVGVADG